MGGLWLITADMLPGFPPIAVSPGESSPYVVRRKLSSSSLLYGEQSEVCSWQGRGWKRELVILSPNLPLLN